MPRALLLVTGNWGCMLVLQIALFYWADDIFFKSLDKELDIGVSVVAQAYLKFIVRTKYFILYYTA